MTVPHNSIEPTQAETRSARRIQYQPSLEKVNINARPPSISQSMQFVAPGRSPERSIQKKDGIEKSVLNQEDPVRWARTS